MYLGESMVSKLNITHDIIRSMHGISIKRCVLIFGTLLKPWDYNGPLGWVLYVIEL